MEVKPVRSGRVEADKCHEIYCTMKAARATRERSLRREKNMGGLSVKGELNLRDKYRE